jgi:uncharacterized membrane protein YidH (DUF202 family)
MDCISRRKAIITDHSNKEAFQKRPVQSFERNIAAWRTSIGKLYFGLVEAEIDRERDFTHKRK